MLQLGIFHEDVFMKMFMIPLEGDDRKWYKNLPPGSISSLREFQAFLHYHCRIFFRDELLLEHYCNGEFELVLEHRKKCSCSSEEEKQYFEFWFE